MTYRDTFSDDSVPIQYDGVEYSDASYGSVLWRLERAQINRILDCQTGTHQFTYLDFACGTGRVLSHVSTLASSSTGIEISAAMAAVAASRVPLAKILVADITAPSADVEGAYDVITAFRFILNAEPELRSAAFRALRQRMGSSSAILIFNNHGNLLSHKALMATPRYLRRRAYNSRGGNTMSHGQVLSLAKDAGLSAHRVAGCGFLGGRVAGILPPLLVDRIEGWFGGSLLWRLGSNQIYVAHLAR
jgi:SAM-dependent methyltransferase